MKNLAFLCLLLAAFACHKKTTTPTPVPDPPAPCVTGKTQFTGKYKYAAGHRDTIEIVFLHNNCPDVNRNTYIVYGLGKALNADLKSPSNYTFSLSPDTLVANESTGIASPKIQAEQVQLKYQAYPAGLYVACPYINEQDFSTGFDKIN